jgi:O-antigen biosynthesis protein
MSDMHAQLDARFLATEASKPIVLHVLHSWGGGIDFFARDLQAGDKYRKHFFLKSHSRDNLPPFGKEFCLYQHLDKEPLATWQLSVPIMDTSLHSDEVVKILDSIIEKWAVGAVVVSSLIGHSLDVLKTGLPTALAVHDTYPFWPLLHAANNDDYSIEYLSRSLLDSQIMNIFAAHDVNYWLKIRDELISLLLQRNIACISPSAFAKERVCRIDTRLNRAHWCLIPHGISAALRQKDSAPVWGEKSPRLKVLVPGHINGGKGEVLLNTLIPNLPDGIELILLGSAHLSERFSSEKVKTIDHYKREELPGIVSRINPDIALLASLVPETYGYIMSEMLQLGIPTIASDIGAYAERGVLLPGVMLVRPDVESFLKALIDFRDSPLLLAKLKEGLPFIFPDLLEMSGRWCNELPSNPPKWLFELNDDPGIENEVKMNLQLTHLTEILKSVHAATERNTQASHSARDLINKQQANIERMLESLDLQNRELKILLVKQGDLEAALLSKESEINLLSRQAEEQKSISEQAMVKLESELDQRTAKLFDTMVADNAGFYAQVAELKTTIETLNGELASMKSKRWWRFLSFFK